MKPNPPKDALEICRTLKAHGHQAWLVGGAVRDSLMGREPNDWDIATDARPELVAGMFERVVLTGLQHGTVTVIRDGIGYEVTTFRGEGAYKDGRRPEWVTFLNFVEDDLARRDFTMNAVAYDPIADVFCDPFGGREAIERKVIACVGDPLTRFLEDGLRVLRAARFAAVLGFTVDPGTLAAIASSIDTYRKVAIERVCAEWSKALLAPRPSVAFRIMAETGILEATVPEMLPMIGCEQNRYHGYDVWEHTLHVLDATPPDLVLRVAALFHDISKPASKGVHERTGDATFYNHEEMGVDATDAILRRLRFSNDVRERAVHLVRHHLVRYEPSWSAATVRRWVRRVGSENVTPLCALARADILGKGPAKVALSTDVIDQLEERIRGLAIRSPIAMSATALAISGADVMAALGIGPSRQVGEALRAMLEVVTDDPELNTREALLGLLTRESTK
jgi:tRNA nucleotidyltransferase (CCA-adding enzyme)